MEIVWLVYEDDYGGTFSPYWLTKVFGENQENELNDYTKTLSGGMYSVIKAEYAGTLELSAYEQTLGGLFNDGGGGLVNF